MKLEKMILFVAVCALLIVPQAMAVQLSPGTIIISGDSNFNFSSDKREFEDTDQTITTFGLNVHGGYVVIDNLEAFVLFDFDSTSTENGEDVTTTYFGLGAGANYYFDLSSELFPYAGGFLGFGNEKTDDGYEETITGFMFGLQGGAKYFLNDHFALDGGLRLTLGMGDYEYKEGGYKNDGDADSTKFELYAGVAVLL
ncbi:porin family protein [bacterium]|nr:porin family protein [bacterium]